MILQLVGPGGKGEGEETIWKQAGKKEAGRVENGGAHLGDLVAAGGGVRICHALPRRLQLGQDLSPTHKMNSRGRLLLLALALAAMSSWAEAKTKKKKVLSFGGNGMIGSEVKKFNNFTFILLTNVFLLHLCTYIPGYAYVGGGRRIRYNYGFEGDVAL